MSNLSQQLNVLPLEEKDVTAFADFLTALFHNEAIASEVVQTRAGDNLGILAMGSLPPPPHFIPAFTGPNPGGPTIISIKVVGTDLVFTLSNNSQMSVPLASLLTNALTAYMADHPFTGTITSATVTASGVLELTPDIGAIVRADLSTYVNAAIVAALDLAPASVIDASLSGNVLTLFKSDGTNKPVTLPTLSSLSVSSSSLMATLSDNTFKVVNLAPAVQSSLMDTQWLTDAGLTNNTLTFKTHVGDPISVPLGPSVKKMELSASNLALTLSDDTIKTVDLSSYVNAAIAAVQDGVTPSVTDAKLTNNVITLTKSNMDTIKLSLPPEPPFLSNLTVSASTLNAILSNTSVRSVDLKPAIQSALSDTQWLSNVTLANNTLNFTTHIGSSIPVPLGPAVTDAFMSGSNLSLKLADNSVKSVDLSSYVNSAIPVAVTDATISGNTLILNKSNSSYSNVTLPSPPSLSNLAVSGNSNLSATMTDNSVKSVDLAPAVLGALSGTQWLSNVTLANNTLNFTTHIGNPIPVPLGPAVTSASMSGSNVSLVLADGSTQKFDLSPYVKSVIPVVVTDVSISGNSLILSKSNSSNSNVTLPSPPSLSNLSVSGNSNLSATMTDNSVKSVDLAPAVLSALSSTQWLSNVTLVNNTLYFTTHIGSSIPVPLGPAVTDVFMSGSNLSLKLADNSVKSVDLSPYVKSAIPVAVTDATISGNTLILDKSDSSNSNVTLPSPPSLSNLSVSGNSNLSATMTDNSVKSVDLAPAVLGALSGTQWLSNVALANNTLTFTTHIGNSIPVPLGSAVTDAFMSGSNLSLKLADNSVKTVDLFTYVNSAIPVAVTDATLSGSTLILNKSNSSNSNVTLPLLSNLTVPSGSTLRATLSDGSSVDGNLMPAINNALSTITYINSVSSNSNTITFGRNGATQVNITLPPPILNASLSNKMLILTPNTGNLVTVDLSNVATPALQQFASDAAAAAAALPVGSLYYDSTGTVRVRMV
jgi:hypothetical protein